MSNDNEPDSAADARPAAPPALSPRDRARRALRFDREFRESTSTLSLSEVLQLVEDRVADAIADAEVAALAGRPAVPPPTKSTAPCEYVIGLTTCGYAEDECMHNGSSKPTIPVNGRHDYKKPEPFVALAAPAVPSSAPPAIDPAASAGQFVSAYTFPAMPEYRDTPDGAVAAYAPERDGPFRCDHCRYSRGERGALQCIKPEMVTESKILRGLSRRATSAPVEDGGCCDFQKPSVNAHA